MTDLAGFLLARIAEDEFAARAALDEGSYLHYGDTAAEETLAMALSEGCAERGPAHFRRHMPARVLAECEAKRRIVEHRRVTEASLRQYLKSGSTMRALAELDGVLALLALPYSDHPEYRAEWRP